MRRGLFLREFPMAGLGRTMAIAMLMAGACATVMASPAGEVSFSLAPSGSSQNRAGELSISPSGPGWLHVPEMLVRVNPTPGPEIQVYVANGPTDDWRQVVVSEGVGRLPLNVSTVSDLWALRFKLEGGDGYAVSLVPSKTVVLTDFEIGSGVQPALTITNWETPGPSA